LNADEESLNGEQYFLDRERGVAYCFYNCIATFRQPLELQSFPFDRHLFGLPFDSSNCLFTKWKETEQPEQFIDEFLDVTSAASNWNLKDALFLVPKDLNSLAAEPSRKIKFALRCQRRTTYYFWNIVFVLFLLISMSFSSVILDPTDLGDRSSIDLTLVLTCVAYKYVVAQQLPAISYLTLMDKYVIFSLMFISTTMVNNFVVRLLADYYSTYVANVVNIVYGATFFAFWVLLHVVLSVISSTERLYKKWEDVATGINSTALQHYKIE